MPARSGTVSGFGNRQAVRIVGAADFATERMAQILIERFAVQPGGVGVFHESGSRGNGSRNAYADTRGAVELLLQFFYLVGYGADRAFVIEPRCGDAMAVKLGSVALEGDKLNFCAAQIHTNAQGIIFSKSHRACPLSNGEHSILQAGAVAQGNPRDEIPARTDWSLVVWGG